jgi:hypothetical protein
MSTEDREDAAEATRAEKQAWSKPILRRLLGYDAEIGDINTADSTSLS